MSRVFVVQAPMRRGYDGRMHNIFDLSPAEMYGELVFVTNSDKLPTDLSMLIEDWRAKLSDFCDDDYLLCVGDPVAIGISTAFCMAANEGRIKFLRWSPKRKAYEELNVDLWQGYEVACEGQDEVEDVSFWR